MTVVDVGCGPGVVHLVSLGGASRRAADRHRSRSRRRSEITQVHQFVPMTDPEHWSVEDGIADLDRLAICFGTCREILRAFLGNVLQDPQTGRPLRVFDAKLYASRGVDFAYPAAWVQGSVVGKARGPRARRLPDVLPTQYTGRRSNVWLPRDCQLDRGDGFKIREFVPQGYLDKYLVGFLACWAMWSVLHYSRLERWFGGSIVGVLRKEETKKESQRTCNRRQSVDDVKKVPTTPFATTALDTAGQL